MSLSLTSFLVKRLYEIFLADALNWFSRLEQCFTCRKPLQGMFNDALVNVNSLNISSVTCLEKEMNYFDKSVQNYRSSFVDLERYVRLLLAGILGFFSDLSRVTFENTNEDYNNNSSNNSGNNGGTIRTHN